MYKRLKYNFLGGLVIQNRKIEEKITSTYSSLLGKTVEMGTFMGLAAILTHYLKTTCKYEIYS